MTTRLFQAVENIGIATSGMLGARLGDRLGMQTSWMTMIPRVAQRDAKEKEKGFADTFEAGLGFV